jgi:hypothetical protein
VRLPKVRHALVIGAALGVLAPLLFFTWHRFQVFIAGGKGAFLWPSGIWLMATDRHEHELGAYLVIGCSVLANVLLYAIIATLLWFILWIIQRGATRTP